MAEAGGHLPARARHEVLTDLADSSRSRGLAGGQAAEWVTKRVSESR